MTDGKLTLDLDADLHIKIMVYGPEYITAPNTGQIYWILQENRYLDYGVWRHTVVRKGEVGAPK